MSISAGKYWGMRRMADVAGRFKMTAVDQRPPIKNPIRAKRGTPQAPWEDVASFKELLIRELQAESSAMLLDPHYAYPRGVTMLDARLGLILTLEDSIFRETPGGRLSAEIDDWSVEKIKRAGGDAVKVLTWYRPDADPEVCAAQRDFTQPRNGISRSRSARPAPGTTSRSCSSCSSIRSRRMPSRRPSTSR